VFGEEVDSAIGYGWLDLVQTYLEAEGYAVGKAVLGACSVGAPHRRQRLYFVADAELSNWRAERQEHGDAQGRERPGRSCHTSELADADGPGLEIGQGDQNGRPAIRFEGQAIAAPSFANGFWSDAEWLLCQPEPGHPKGRYRAVERATESKLEQIPDGLASELGLVRHEGGAQIFSPLIQKTRNRVGRLRGYGDAIVAPVAEAFIRAYMEASNS